MWRPIRFRTYADFKPVCNDILRSINSTGYFAERERDIFITCNGVDITKGRCCGQVCAAIRLQITRKLTATVRTRH
jgi:hypothetical protein